MWDIITTACFDEWFLAQESALRESVYEAMGVLEKFGPQLGRPYVDTLNDSDFANMKELRVQHAGNPILTSKGYSRRHKAGGEFGRA
ncbi:TPA: type II toxin-antitoxin system RelE/ParE family toxin [Escherichia coli]